MDAERTQTVGRIDRQKTSPAHARIGEQGRGYTAAAIVVAASRGQPKRRCATSWRAVGNSSENFYIAKQETGVESGPNIFTRNG